MSVGNMLGNLWEKLVDTVYSAVSDLISTTWDGIESLLPAEVLSALDPLGNLAQPGMDAGRAMAWFFGLYDLWPIVLSVIVVIVIILIARWVLSVAWFNSGG